MSAIPLANASNAASGSSPAYNLLANEGGASAVRLGGSEDSMMARAVSNIEEAILIFCADPRHELVALGDHFVHFR